MLNLLSGRWILASAHSLLFPVIIFHVFILRTLYDSNHLENPTEWKFVFKAMLILPKENVEKNIILHPLNYIIVETAQKCLYSAV